MILKYHATVTLWEAKTPYFPTDVRGAVLQYEICSTYVLPDIYLA
jgi:hypothetical protein